MNINKFVRQPLAVAVSVSKDPTAVAVKNLLRIVRVQLIICRNPHIGDCQSVAGLGDVRIFLPVVKGQPQCLILGADAVDFVKNGNFSCGECLVVIHTYRLAVNGIILRRVAVEGQVAKGVELVILSQLILCKIRSQIAEYQIHIPVAPKVVAGKLRRKNFAVGGLVVTQLIGGVQGNGKVKAPGHAALQRRKGGGVQVHILRQVGRCVVRKQQKIYGSIAPTAFRKQGKVLWQLAKIAKDNSNFGHSVSPVSSRYQPVKPCMTR